MTESFNKERAKGCPVGGRVSANSHISRDIQFGAIFEYSLNGIIVIDAKGIVEQFNPAAAKIFGYSKTEVIGQNVSILMPFPLRTEHDEYLAHYNSTGNSSIIGRDRDVYAQKKDGTEFPIELAVVELLSDENRYFIGEFRDLTPRRKQEHALSEANALLERRVEERTKELELSNKILEKEIQERKLAQEATAASLREKEIFLREIHHRVKNNLQLVISILNLHRAKIKDKDGLQVIHEIRDRIYAIAHLHETLYHSGEFGFVRADKYLCGLVNHLLQTTNNGLNIDIKFDIEPITLSLDDSLPCGLIVNELVLNSFKHAFINTIHPKIEISLHRSKAGEICILVKDNGAGYSPHQDVSKADSIGLHLVEKLAQKLGGSVSFRSESGACSKITFTPEVNNS